MKSILTIVLMCTFVLTGSVLAEKVIRPPTPKEIAENPELIVDAIKDLNSEKAAGMVVKVLDVIRTINWSEARKREATTALIAYAVAAKGAGAAPMMGAVAKQVPAASLPLIAATAVVAAGDNSPAVANAIIAAAGNNTQVADASRAACANPSAVLSPSEIGAVRGIILPTPSQAPAKAPPLPTIIPQGAQKYPGQ